MKHPIEYVRDMAKFHHKEGSHTSAEMLDDYAEMRDIAASREKEPHGVVTDEMVRIAAHAINADRALGKAGVGVSILQIEDTAVRAALEAVAPLLRGVPDKDAPWHAPGIGEVHSRNDDCEIYCSKYDAHEDNQIVDDELAKRVCAALNATAKGEE